MKEKFFPEWLEAEMKRQKLTQRELASRSDVNHSSISRLLRQKREPMLGTAFALAKALGYTIVLQKETIE